LGERFGQWPEFRDIGDLLQRSSRGLVFPQTVTKPITSQMTELFSLSEGFDRAVALLRILEALSSTKARSLASAGFSDQVSTRSVERLGRIMELIDQRTELGEPVPLKEVATVAALHPQSVSRFFQQHTGMNFQRYLQVIRVGKAARKLIETDDPVSSIAMDVGYSTQSNFNRQFLEIHEMTPSEYRREVRVG
ncbi:MAG: AraC family transcriptional regulator, partial [Verrucomicrobiota bacterium]